MRVNVYAEEMTDRVEIVSKVINGVEFTGLRIYLELPVTRMNPNNGLVEEVKGPFIHRHIKAGINQGEDDDSSAITFWGKKDLRDVMWKAIDVLSQHYKQREGSGDGMSNWMGKEKA